MESRIEAYKAQLQQLSEEKKRLITNLSEKNLELQAREKRVTREEFRISKEQQKAIQEAPAEEQKVRYGNVEKRDADLFTRKEKDSVYQQYVSERDKTLEEIKSMQLEQDIKRQEEKYLFKEIELLIALMNFEASKKTTEAKL